MKQNDNVIFGQDAPEVTRSFKINQQYGRVGQKKYAGVFYEEFLPQLQGKKGIEAYKEMAESDDIVGAVFFAIEMLIRQVKWDCEPQGNTEADKEAAEFIKSCIDDINPGWQDTLSEILSFLTYGWSYHEICYKRRMGRQKDYILNSKYDDGLIGWEGFPIRAQDTLFKWEYDANDRLVGMTQMAPPEYSERTIPYEKALHFKTRSTKANPEGRSVLRNAYRLWYFKKRMQEIEGIGVERDLAGLPTLTAPDGVDLWDPNDEMMVQMLNTAEMLVQNIRRDALEGVVLPSGWKLELLSGGSRRQFEIGTIIERYDTRIAMTTLADFVMLGHESVGSFALSSNKTKLFSVALGTYLDIITTEFNDRAIPKLIDLNAAHFKGITNYPKLVHNDLEERSLIELATYIREMTGAGILVPDENLEDYVRREAGLPDRTEGAQYPEYDDESEEAIGTDNQPNVNTENNEDTDERDIDGVPKSKRGKSTQRGING